MCIIVDYSQKLATRRERGCILPKKLAMTKIGRNSPCPCSSGKKFKHCCGSFASNRPDPAVIAEAQRAFARRDAREYQRRLIQGLGRPIVSVESHGYRIVVVGSDVLWSKNWRTFPDFLFDYFKRVLTPEWGNAELAKPEAGRHPLFDWYRRVCDFQRAHPRTGPGGLYQADATGAVRAYLGLAYDLYLCAHNAELPELLLKRLRNAQTFEGALYEAYVIGNLAKAGFDIELEDETDPTRSHCELTARHRETGRKFSVEAKMTSSSSNRAGASAAPPKIRGRLHAALSKQADHPRLIFVELNRAEPLEPPETPEWATQIDREMEQAEVELTVDGNPAPPAYVIVTNRAFAHALEQTRWREAIFACGFKIPDFGSRTPARSILELVDARDRHIEMHWLCRAMHRQNIPNTFDDRLPEEAFGQMEQPRLTIGETYQIPDGNGREVPGVLTEAVVMEHEKLAYGIYETADGCLRCTTPLTDDEIAIYRRSPATFFGVVRMNGARLISEPIDAFDFFWESYANCSRENLLKFMSDWPAQERLAMLSQKELARLYCARMAEHLWARKVADDRRPPPGQPIRETSKDEPA